MIWHETRSLWWGRTLGALLCALTLVAASVAGHAQTLVSIENGKIVASVGQEGDLNSVGVAGRFGIVQAGATGEVLLQLPRSTDLNQLGSFVTVRIDGGTPFLADGSVAEGVPGWDIAWGYEDTPDTDITGEWVQEPTVVSPNVIVAKWRTVPDSEAEPPIPEIRVDLEMRLLYDMVLYKFTITNRDSTAHTVGLRFAQDFAVPGTVDGPVLTPTNPAIRNETELLSTFIPSYWRAAGEAGSVGAVLLPSGVSSYPTPPDRVVFGRTSEITGNLWTFTPDKSETFVGTLTDGSAAVYYNPLIYAPGQTRTIAMVFGAAGASYELGQRLAAGIEGPVSLTYDPTKPEDERLQPSPFKVTAFLSNLNAVALTNVRAVLSLPPGLELAPGQTAAKTQATVPVDGEATFTWEVVPTGTASGRLTYTVSMSANPGGQGISVAREIEIPALPSQDMGAGWRMVSFPYLLDDRTPEGALNLTPGLYDLVRWNPTQNVYQAVRFLNPGEGYWLRLQTPATVTLADARPVKPAGGLFETPLTVGWNQIGNPYLLPVRWGDLKVMNLDSTDRDYLKPMSIAEASDVTRRWISGTIFYYDTQAGMYKFDPGLATELRPFEGYWIRVMKPNLILLVEEPSGRAARASTASRAVTPSGGWRLRLQASNGRSADGWNFIGVSPTASDGMDSQDVPKPPAAHDSVTLSIIRTDLGLAPERLAQDVRAAAGGTKVWQIAVTSPEPNSEVVLTWPDMSTLPRTHELYISDGLGSTRRSMRQISSLRVNTGPDGTRMVTIWAEPRSAGGAFRILSWNAAQTRGKGSAVVSVSATQPASLAVLVLGPNGAVVRRLTSRAEGQGQVSQITWDLRDSRGASVPAGSYTIEIKATAADGQSARVVAPLVIVR